MLASGVAAHSFYYMTYLDVLRDAKEWVAGREAFQEAVDELFEPFCSCVSVGQRNVRLDVHGMSPGGAHIETSSIRLFLCIKRRLLPPKPPAILPLHPSLSLHLSTFLHISMPCCWYVAFFGGRESLILARTSSCFRSRSHRD
jgi:hypothetical protein